MSANAIDAQELVGAANKFINALDKEQKSLAVFPFDVDERFNFQ